MPVRNLVIICLATIISLACFSIAVKNRYASIFSEALSIVKNEALVEKSERELFNAAMDGMLGELDPNSGFISHDRFKAFDEDINQEFVGVGMEVERDDKRNCIRVVTPIPGSPASRAGLQVGDRIVGIDGQPTADLPRPDAIDLIRGPKGKKVTFLVERDGEESPLTIEVLRDSIPVPSVYGDTRNADGSWNFFLHDDPRIGYVRLTQFGKRSTAEMQAALKSLEGRIDAFILDLRYNPGGLLDSAVEISDMFIGREVLIVQTRQRDGEVVRRRYATSKTLLSPKIPVAVIVNEYSASGSEIVAACLQDHGRAIVVGKQTWGKGTVQDLITLEQNRSVLRLTTASYWRPSGKNIDRTVPGLTTDHPDEYGVRPDPGYEVLLSEQEMIDIATARSRRDQELGPPPDSVPPRDSGPASSSAWPEVDRPLARAVDYLHSLVHSRSAA